MLALSHLAKRYRSVVALDDLSLVARPGRILGFLGPNGAGKTTAMRSVFGLVDLDDGAVTWQGAQITADARLHFGYMPEQRGLYRRMPAAAQLAFMGRLHGMSRGDADAAARQWLERLGLGDRTDDVVSDLSHGNQQRVQLAAALVHDPALLVLDEPFSGLDPLGVTAMSQVLVERARDGATVVFSSHQLDLVEDLVDDVVIIANGRDRMTGTLDDVRSSTGTTNVVFRLDRRHPARVEFTDGNGRIISADVTTHGDRPASMSVPAGIDPGLVLDRIADHGVVQRFSFEPPTLSQVFRDVVGMTIAEAEEAKEAKATAEAEVTEEAGTSATREVPS